MINSRFLLIPLLALLSCAAPPQNSPVAQTLLPGVSAAQTAPAAAALDAPQSAAVSAAAAPRKAMTEAEKIEALIAGVEKSTGLRFIRNGVEYNAAAGGKHMRDKLQAAGASVRTARDFIDKLASSSLKSGLPYRIKSADGKLENSRDYLNRKLAELEKGP